MEQKDIKVNEKAKALLAELRLTAVDMGRAIGLSNDAAYKLLKRTDWKISEMKAVGDYVDFNFFEMFVEAKPKLEDKILELKAKDEELNALRQKMAFVEQENKYLKELVEMAKMKLKH